MRSPTPARSAPGRQQFGQLKRSRLAQSHEVERVAPCIQLLAAARGDQLRYHGRQYRGGLVPAHDIEGFERLVDEIQSMTAIGKDAVGDGSQQQRRDLAG